MTSNETDKTRADIGIVSALPIELGQFMDRCERVKHYKGGDLTFRGGRYDGIRIVVAESGMGYARARKATQAMIDAHAPKWILSSGFAGALLPTMKLGEIVMANEIVDQHGQQISINLTLASDEANGLYVGRILTADEMVRTVEEKKQLHEKHEAIAVDMESLAVAQVAAETKTGFMAVRVISDDMSADLPSEILSVIGDTGAVRVGAALTSLFKRPESLKDMLHLRTNALAAAKSLATFLDGVVHQLHKA
ncbi:MAG: 5'-methylthioadenosine nucleosidase [Planctomycetota bacterium]|nr:5'-methylthioadenosine nucleosidase [Planctomycetota bacterium]MDA0919586.1 5'-methylthioadenosine nucleosidase [Planctomycetota bacterium]MDA1160623.1 5'-methylthioadenosine nucleosidase [Planctomycetota bacterium]